MDDIIMWNNLKITIPYVMGQLSEKKLVLIVDTLKKNGFQNAKLVMANSNAAAIKLEEDQKSLVIEPHQINYGMSLDGSVEWDSVQFLFESILNSLLIDNKNKYMFGIEGVTVAEDSHTDSKKLFEERYMPLDNEIYGVGYRFLIRNEKVFGEFKIEPLVLDKSGYYYQWILNKNEKVTVAQMLCDMKEAIEKNRSSCYSVIRS